VKTFFGWPSFEAFVLGQFQFRSEILRATLVSWFGEATISRLIASGHIAERSGWCALAK